MKALQDEGCEKRVTTAAFWFILAATFIVGPYLPRWITGLCVILLSVLTALGRVSQSKSDVPAPEATRAAGVQAITPERVAINQDDARIPDNEGNHLMYGVLYTLDKKYPGVGGALH